MKLEVFDDAERWLAAGQPVALATVVRTGGSSPRPVGSALAISGSGEMAGSVSGGCIEGAVVVEAESVLEGGAPKLLRYGIADEDAWAVGLSCGGDIEVFLERLSKGGWFDAFLADARAERPRRSAVVIGPADGDDRGWLGLRAAQPGATGPWIAQDAGRQAESLVRWLDDAASADGVHAWPAGASDRRPSEPSGTPALDVFVHTHQPPDRLVITGAVHIAEHLVSFAQRLGFHCTVIDAREAFATPARFGHADDLLIGWPGEVVRELPLRASSYCVCLTHDPKFDDPVLLEALAADARYIGALGSPRTHAKRLARLEELLKARSANTQRLERIDAPIGVDLGGRKPEEIALSIAARLIQVRAGRWPSGGTESPARVVEGVDR